MTKTGENIINKKVNQTKNPFGLSLFFCFLLNSTIERTEKINDKIYIIAIGRINRNLISRTIGIINSSIPTK